MWMSLISRMEFRAGNYRMAQLQLLVHLLQAISQGAWLCETAKREEGRL